MPAALAEEAAPETETEEAAAAPAASASADTPAWLGAEPEVAEADIVETKETTLLIIGAGTSGLACAATAVDMGLDFFLAEKLPVISESREYFGAVNTAQQIEAGLEFDKGMLLNELSRYASGKCDRDVIKIWIDESAETVAWYTPMFNAVGESVIVPDYTEEQAGGTLYYSPVTEMMSGTFYIPPTRNEVILSHIEASGHEVAYSYDLVKLVHGEGGVTGAIFDTDEGYVQVNAKYTVIATGGYAANAEMMMALQPDAVACTTAAAYNPPCTGQGIKAGMWGWRAQGRRPRPDAVRPRRGGAGCRRGLRGPGRRQVRPARHHVPAQHRQPAVPQGEPLRQALRQRVARPTTTCASRPAASRAACSARSSTVTPRTT